MKKDLIYHIKNNIPTPDCYLTIDKNGTPLKPGDILTSKVIRLRSSEKEIEKYQPVEKRDGHLVVPHCGSYLVKNFVETHCEIFS